MNESDKKRFNMRKPGEVLVSAEVYSGPISILVQSVVQLTSV